MTTDAKYIYGFISTNEYQNLGPNGIDQGEVYTFSYKDISAVVSNLQFVEFDHLPKETLLRNLAIYQAVIETVMMNHHIIPLKFGTMVQGEEELRRILEKGYDHINSDLKKMENKMELDVAALWSDLDTVLKEIGQEEGIRKLKEEAASKPPDQIFEVKIKVGKLVKASLDKRKEECASFILDALKKEAEDHRSHDIMDDSMILNAAFLINKDKQEILEGKVDELDRYYQDKINFRIVGPLPPYSFSTYEVKRVEFEDLNEAREMLGLGKETTAMEIKETYWDLTRKFHPDKFPGDPEAQKRFEKINKAYRVLNDYCLEDHCSFKEADVSAWRSVRPVEQQGTA